MTRAHFAFREVGVLGNMVDSVAVELDDDGELRLEDTIIYELGDQGGW